MGSRADGGGVMSRLDPLAAVATAQANLDRLLERREAGLAGAGPVPAPETIEAAERAVEAAKAKLGALAHV